MSAIVENRAVLHRITRGLLPIGLPLLLHVFVCLGWYQYGLRPDEMDRLRVAGPSHLITPYVRAVKVFGPLGAIRAFLRGEQDERLYLEYAKLALVGHADIHFIAERQNARELAEAPLPARAWPYRDVRVEYPPLAFLAILPPALLSFDYRTYRYAFAGYMLLLHLLNLWMATRLLRRAHPPDAGDAPTTERATSRTLYLSVGFLFALGSVVVTRMDHLVVTATLAVLLAFERGQHAPAAHGVVWATFTGALTGLGVMTKLVPGLAGVAVCALWWTSHTHSRVARVLACASACVAVLAAFNVALYAFAGDAYIATFRYHSLRGVQLESLWAGAIMLLRPFGFAMQIDDSFGSTNLASAATTLVKPLSLAAFAVVAAYLVFGRRFAADGRGALVLTSALLLAFMLTQRVFSPQYLIWIGAPLCVLASEQRPLRRGFWLFFGAILLSQLIFPRGYPLLKALHPLGIALLNLRNLLLIAFGVWLVRRESLPRSTPNPARST
ncbi:MAG: glycosyltransferase 87 family protein [Polyangiales bacterium]